MHGQDPLGDIDRTAPIRIGVSACLLGWKVRYDGGDKRSDFIAATLGSFAEFVAVCPEVEMGLGTPRRSLRLAGNRGSIRLVENPPRTDVEGPPSDYTRAMNEFARSRVAALAEENLSGYVLKKDSPSCGMERVSVHGPAGPPTKDGRGMFAAELIRAYPNLPVAEEGCLADTPLRENFIERMFAYRDLRGLFRRQWRNSDLVAFHAAHKFQILAHSRVAYERLGRIVAGAGGTARDALETAYSDQLMSGLKQLATPAGHKNVLEHMAGYLKKLLDDAERHELRETIENYRRGMVPLIVPITLLRHHARRHDVAYLMAQTYLAPNPIELISRNHA